MSLAAIPAVLNAASPLLGGLFQLVDELFTSPEERDTAKLRILELHHQGALGQLEVNKAEAAHTSLFVAGWRPFVGWVCGLAFAWSFLLYPMFTAVVSYIAVQNGVQVDFSGVPQADMQVMLPVLFGMLGLGAMRTYEKTQAGKAVQ